MALPLLAVCPGGEEPEHPEGHLHHAEDADPGEETQDTTCNEDEDREATITIALFNIIYLLPKDDSLSKKLSLLLMTVTDRVLVASLKMTSALY